MFDVEETGLFFRYLPEKTLKLKKCVVNYQKMQ